MRRDVIAVLLLLPLAAVATLFLGADEGGSGSGAARSETGLLAAWQTTFASPVVFQAVPLEGGDLGDLATSLDGAPVAVGQIVDGGVAIRLGPTLFGGEGAELRLFGTDRGYLQATNGLRKVLEPLGIRLPNADEIRIVLEGEGIPERDIELYVAAQAEGWFEIDFGTSGGAGDFDEVLRGATVLSTGDAVTVYSLGSGGSLAGGAADLAEAVGLPELATADLTVTVTAGRVSSLLLGRSLRIDLGNGEADAAVVRPDGAVRIDTDELADLGSVADYVAPVQSFYESGGAGAAAAYLADVRTVQFAVRDATGSFTAEVTDLDDAGLRRPPFVILLLCTYDDGAAFASLTARAGASGETVLFIDDSAWDAAQEATDEVAGSSGCDPLSENAA